ncbi:MAG: ABC transporter ATP-binding protein [Candidatus Bipolaricaulia bacterium]
MNEGEDKDGILVADELTKLFPVGGQFVVRDHIRAVDGVSFSVKPSTVFCLVGESGCGKTTIARLVLRLLKPTNGALYLHGREIFSFERREYRRTVQMVFQDPYAVLNPLRNVYHILSRPLKIHGLAPRAHLPERVHSLLEMVKLTPTEEYAAKYPHQLSGGERQRVAIARALSVNPRLLVLDEPVSMLDMSIRVSILNLLIELKSELGLSYVYITHDLATAKYFGDEMATMYLGKIIEIGEANEVIENPLHPYTQLLIASIPSIDSRSKRNDQEKIKTQEEGMPNPANLPTGCRFHPRCPHVMEECRGIDPELVEVEKGRFVACYLYDSQIRREPG